MEGQFEHNGVSYYTVKEFAHLTDKTTGTIYRLISKGNSIRKLKCERVNGNPAVPASELNEFPFVTPGFSGKENVRHYGEANSEGPI